MDLCVGGKGERARMLQINRMLQALRAQFVRIGVAFSCTVHMKTERLLCLDHKAYQGQPDSVAHSGANLEGDVGDMQARSRNI